MDPHGDGGAAASSRRGNPDAVGAGAVRAVFGDACAEEILNECGGALTLQELILKIGQKQKEMVQRNGQLEVERLISHAEDATDNAQPSNSKIAAEELADGREEICEQIRHSMLEDTWKICKEIDMTTSAALRMLPMELRGMPARKALSLGLLPPNAAACSPGSSQQQPMGSPAGSSGAAACGEAAAFHNNTPTGGGSAVAQQLRTTRQSPSPSPSSKEEKEAKMRQKEQELQSRLKEISEVKEELSITTQLLNDNLQLGSTDHPLMADSSQRRSLINSLMGKGRSLLEEDPSKLQTHARSSNAVPKTTMPSACTGGA